MPIVDTGIRDDDPPGATANKGLLPRLRFGCRSQQAMAHGRAAGKPMAHSIRAPMRQQFAGGMQLAEIGRMPVQMDGSEDRTQRRFSLRPGITMYFAGLSSPPTTVMPRQSSHA